MGKVKIELNSAGVRELLKSAEMESGLKSLTEGIAGRAGSGYAADSKQMGTRVVASAYTEDPAAMRDNSENNTLLRCLG